MALIKCSECGKEISDKSKNCIHCGCPINKEKITHKEKIETKKENIKRNIQPIFKIFFILIAIICVLFLIFSISKTLKIKKLKKDFVEETYYCRKSTGNYLHKAELNSIDFTSIKVHIEENHSDTSKSPDNLKEFFDEVCETQKYAYGENQINYTYECGDKKDIINYTYVGTMNDALNQLKTDGYECYTIEKSDDLLNKVKNKNWCNYRQYKYFYTFDEMAIKNVGSLTYEYSYSTIDNMIIIYNGSYDTKYTYDEEKNILIEDSSFGDYLFECETPEELYSLIKEKYYYDGKLNTNMPKSGFYKDDEYKFNRVECDNGITATFDINRKMLFPNENKKAECIIYFDNLQN